MLIFRNAFQEISLRTLDLFNPILIVLFFYVSQVLLQLLIPTLAVSQHYDYSADLSYYRQPLPYSRSIPYSSSIPDARFFYPKSYQQAFSAYPYLTAAPYNQHSRNNLIQQSLYYEANPVDAEYLPIFPYYQQIPLDQDFSYLDYDESPNYLQGPFSYDDQQEQDQQQIQEEAETGRKVGSQERVDYSPYDERDPRPNLDLASQDNNKNLNSTHSFVGEDVVTSLDSRSYITPDNIVTSPEVATSLDSRSYITPDNTVASSDVVTPLDSRSYITPENVVTSPEAPLDPRSYIVPDNILTSPDVVTPLDSRSYITPDNDVTSPDVPLDPRSYIVPDNIVTSLDPRSYVTPDNEMEQVTEDTGLPDDSVAETQAPPTDHTLMDGMETETSFEPDQSGMEEGLSFGYNPMTEMEVQPTADLEMNSVSSESGPDTDHEQLEISTLENIPLYQDSVARPYAFKTVPSEWSIYAPIDQVGNFDSTSDLGEIQLSNFMIQANANNEDNANANPENESSPMSNEAYTPTPVHDDVTDNLDLEVPMFHGAKEASQTKTIDDTSAADTVQSSPLPVDANNKENLDLEIPTLSDSINTLATAVDGNTADEVSKDKLEKESVS
jgi:hypothetical protein